jgi:RimJ/RimL family protein N-acetyltransferase
MLSVTSSPDTSRILVELGQWRVVELVLDAEKAMWLWQEMNKYRTLFSDLTRGDTDNFSALISLTDSYWLEVLNEQDETIGIVYWTNMANAIDPDVHIMFFDRKPVEKTELCKEIARWFFLNNPQAHRMSATLPVIYRATIRLAERIGFKFEGQRRESILIGGKLVDEKLFGLLAKEIL